ncbi:MAG: LysM peptidoglycan-binding domain-containing protein [Clostridium sp.]|jgi:LysM repeat protein|uniref:LysM peptidoglycan-binding domain-containing protein n=1 Tax=Clostridium sp. TaxID=1506 RepID=UPI0025BC24E0|nr:LysM peptidoglycan-binding domain-containing protein [Clostridium sp.]MCH3964480.1 LysM peptidoglycan-binding domain-containing protein [Clostridium sp.]MCI1714952.1 LysM peptidoglycan-binding domain-containing protein [Clostridium sp.]MCI1799214.1 LysM peptidoglycan-binding domain-containing protein [Clostridium sp.]MCI1813135.1 LysM peptidoglycan-binding domain-containing protein [Clostridium sp.]MCI1870025.1 LysM peptidoglycan-binding domain-containing protein [Clostridium sp.]
MRYNYYRQCSANHYPYTIQPGDTLYSISQRLEVSLERLIAANPGINPYYLQVGQIICIPACMPSYTPRIIRPGDTLYKIAREYNVSIGSILEANPGIDPNYLRVGQRLCIPSANGECSNCRETVEALQEDVDMLIPESSVQQTHESNYGDSTQTTAVLMVNSSKIHFDAVPVIFSGNYTRHYTEDKSYPYYADAASGGQRGINVKDNFGVWHSFGYRVPIA